MESGMNMLSCCFLLITFQSPIQLPLIGIESPFQFFFSFPCPHNHASVPTCLELEHRSFQYCLVFLPRWLDLVSPPFRCQN